MKNEVNKGDTVHLSSEMINIAPPLYQVVVYNDDFTPMEFVAWMLERCFFMDRRKATETMLEAHIKGKATCGIFSRDLAETKVAQVADLARQHEHPLTCGMEVA